MKYRIAQIGTFDYENFGDLLFPIVFENKIKKYLDVDKIFLFSPEGGKMPFYTEKEVYPLNRLEEMIKKEKINAIVIGGGDLIRFDKDVATNYGNLYYTTYSLWQLPIILANKYGIPIVFNSPGIPFNITCAYKEIAEYLLNSCDYLSVRDNASKDKLKLLNLTQNVSVIPDTILTISDVYNKNDLNIIFEKLKDEFSINYKYVIFQHNSANMTNKQYIELLKEELKKIVDSSSNHILFMPIGYVHNDGKEMLKIFDENNKKMHFINRKLSPIEMLALISNSNCFIGTSLHGLITTNSYNIPALSINPRHLTKVTGYLKQIKCLSNDINSVSFVFKKYRNCINKKLDLKESLKQIDEHFEHMAEIILSYGDVPKKDFEENFINKVYYGLYSSPINTNNILRVYLDNGNGYNEYDKREIICKSSLKLDINLEDITKNIRIDPIEDKFIVINEIKILDNKGNDVPFVLSKSVFYDNKYYMITNDPQIVIKNEDYKNIQILLDYDVIDNFDFITDIIRQNEILKERIENIENKKLYILYRKIMKIGRRK